jgi:hypothetical protein
MFDPLAEPKRALLLVLQEKTVTEVAEALTNEDRSRVRDWREERVGIGPFKAQQIAKFASEFCCDKYGMPLINWKLQEADYLAELRQADTLEPEQVRADAYLDFYNAPAVFRFATLDVRETAGDTCQDTVRRALLNLLGMHVAWRVAVTHPTSERPDARSLVHLAVHRAAVACTLLHHARTEQADHPSLWTDKELTVLWLYARLNYLAMLSLFRKSLADIRGFWVFDDQEAWAHIDDDIMQQLSAILREYRKGHPDRLTVASDTLVVASVRMNKAIAQTAWLAMIDENADAADLRVKLPTHERPLADSPDLAWLIRENGGPLYNPAQF